ncbi:hypothetical protein AIF0345_0467 [Actinomyces israelii]|nr:hypothetical protein AIF0345_0467 [Actinomyces israelii]
MATLSIFNRQHSVPLTMSEFGDPEYFDSPPLSTPIWSTWTTQLDKRRKHSIINTLNIEKPALPALKSMRKPVAIDSKGEIARLNRRLALDRILIDPVHEARCSIDFDEESTCTGNPACFPAVPLKFPSPPIAPCPASWLSNAGATTHVPGGERRRAGLRLSWQLHRYNQGRLLEDFGPRYQGLPGHCLPVPAARPARRARGSPPRSDRRSSSRPVPQGSPYGPAKSNRTRPIIVTAACDHILPTLPPGSRNRYPRPHQGAWAETRTASGRAASSTACEHSPGVGRPLHTPQTPATRHAILPRITAITATALALQTIPTWQKLKI